jgi:hypothetical protein
MLTQKGGYTYVGEGVEGLMANSITGNSWAGGGEGGESFPLHPPAVLSLPYYGTDMDTFVKRRRNLHPAFADRDRTEFMPPHYIQIPPKDFRPARPTGVLLSSALEINTTDCLQSARCKNGPIIRDSWHVSRRARDNCMEAITIYTANPSEIPLWVQDRTGVGCPHDFYRLFPEKYLLDIPLNPGLNHLTFCKDTGITIADYTPNRYLSSKGPIIYMDTKSSYYTEYLYSPSKKTYIQLHEKLNQGHSPCSNLMKPGQPYHYILVYHPSADPLPLWMSAQLAAGLKGFDMKNQGLQLPDGLVKETYHHLQYKIFDKSRLPADQFEECCGTSMWIGKVPPAIPD